MRVTVTSTDTLTRGSPGLYCHHRWSKDKSDIHGHSEKDSQALYCQFTIHGSLGDVSREMISMDDKRLHMATLDTSDQPEAGCTCSY